MSQDPEKQPLTPAERQPVDGLVRETTQSIAAGLLCLLLLCFLSACTWTSAARLYPEASRPLGFGAFLFQETLPANSIAIFRCQNPRSAYLEDILPELLNTLPTGIYDQCFPAQHPELLFKHQVAWLPKGVPQRTVAMAVEHGIMPIVDDRGVRKDLYRASHEVIWLSDFQSPEHLLDCLKAYL